MPCAEYLAWQEYYEIEPFGTAVHDALNAYLIASMANMKRNPEVKPDAYQAKEFLLFGEPNEEAKLIEYKNADTQTEAMIACMFGRQVNRSDLTFKEIFKDEKS